MAPDQQPNPPLFTQVDISQDSLAGSMPSAKDSSSEITRLLQQMLAAQDRQNELLEELIAQRNASQRQRSEELGQWKQSNPELARQCRDAAESLGKVHTEFLRNLTDEINQNFDALMDGEFMLTEFVDRFGPRLAHLNGVLQILSQLAATGESNDSA